MAGEGEGSLGFNFAGAGPKGGVTGDSGARGGSGVFDNSGWNVSFGDNSGITSASSDLKTYIPWAIAAAVGLVVWKMYKKR
jgi:hypothetical protein